LTTYDWIKSFLKITIEWRSIYGNLENKINTLYWPVEKYIEIMVGGHTFGLMQAK
jgi:hypothetical protein